ncbi:D-alanyl-D-alanine carboxypeptidase (penicillin-binding protein 5/6) [Microbacterium sp. cf046]|uniref:D-alanyl-D-alanine carboxypeptidase family protein n=1 Tax=Microbacterium sp. cf046 TaxID=1761803 RepID=UPI0008E2008C|nr:D-alanyl-D-alanine carboxypeptidase [Microbacterium sp. cf046]SFS13398.1 D-alanyl-D-alanine carboxypeptidase (penicillin-binding protein 5/6) [Microbacterium sp. cf046]
MTPEDASTPTRRSRSRSASSTVAADPFGRGDALGSEAAAQTATIDAADAFAPASDQEASSSVTPAPAVGASTVGVVDAVAQPHSAGGTSTLPIDRPADSVAPARIAIAWVDEDAIAHAQPAAATLDGAGSPYLPVGPELLSNPPRRSPLRAGVLVPIAIAALVVGAYSATTLLWPLHAIPPTVEAVQVDPIVSAPAALTFPGAGSASVSVAGINGVVASAGDAVQIASITKIVTALLVLDQMPLALGEQGPEFRFTYEDQLEYWDYLANNESALDVPVDGSLTEYQLLQGMLIGSANNYADRLAGNLWPTDAVFANAANTWLAAHGVPGVTVVEPTGLDPRNAASPEALITLAKKAMADPVIAQIVGMPTVELPGAGLVTNTNGLLADPGVVGIKTGSLDSYNLLSAKDILVGETTVRVYSAVLGQPDDASRLAASRTLYAEVEAGLQPLPSVTKGTVAGHVTTVWGEDVAVVTTEDADVILWNGGSGVVSTTFSLGDAVEKGAEVGTLSVQGPLDSTSTTLALAADIEPPTAWWRLTHPLELFGLS